MVKNKENIITKLERGRAEFAYKCVFYIVNPNKDGITLNILQKALEENLKKELNENKITKERIEELLKSIQNFCKKENYESLSESGKKIVNHYKKLNENYRSYVKRLPQMILSNGLGQALAFIYSKKKMWNAYDFLYFHISQYLESEIPARIPPKEKDKDLAEWVISLDSLQYRYVTEEVLAFLNWLKRFAEGMIEVGGEE